MKEFGNILGLKNIERYKLLIYMVPRVQITSLRMLLRDYPKFLRSIEVVSQLALALNEVVKYTALKLIQKALIQGRIEKTNIGME